MAVILAAIGALLSVLGVGGAVWHWRQLAGRAFAMGTVSRRPHHQPPPGQPRRRIGSPPCQVTFRDAAGAEHTVPAPNGFGGHPGEVIPIHYDRRHPARWGVCTFAMTYAGNLAVALLGLTVLIVPLAWGLAASRFYAAFHP